jgi:hypothetical protein
MTATNPLVAIGVPSGDMVHADFAMHLANLCANPGAHLLFLDSDMTFPPDTLKRLLAHNKDIIGALYSRRSEPFLPTGTTLDGRHVSSADGMTRMKIMPTGCLLIAMKIFDRLTKPWFNTRVHGETLLGEDYYFCERAAEAGFEIWCDGALSREIGHIGQKIYTTVSG